VIDVYKRDLTEFSHTIAADTASVAERELSEADGSVAKTVHTTLVSAVSSLPSALSSLATAIEAVVAPGDESLVNVSAVSDAPPHASAASAAAAAVTVVPSLTVDGNEEASEALYCSDPAADDAELFSAWKSAFVLADRPDDISRVLAEKEHVRVLHAKLVPDAVSYRDFWTRFFYHDHKRALAKQRRDELIRRANDSTANPQPAEDLGWEDEDEAKLTEPPSAPVATEPPTLEAPLVAPVQPAPIAAAPNVPAAALATEQSEDWGGDWE
jgi:hypothetical protein